MRAQNHGYGPGLAAPDAASSSRAADAASVVADAVAPAGLTAQKESAPAAQAAQSREENQHGNSATGADADKGFSTLRARLALAGFTVHLTDDGACGCAYLVSRWAQYRTFADRDALAAFEIGRASCRERV